jgi:hypothetical protein
MLRHRELSSALEDLSLWAVPGVNCLYVNGWLVLFFYVDDIVALCMKSNVAKLREFETRLLKKFEFCVIEVSVRLGCARTHISARSLLNSGWPVCRRN